VAVSGHKCYAADAMGTAAANDILCAEIYHDRWVAQAIGTHRPPPGAVNDPAFDHPIPSPHSGFAPAVEQWQLGAENDWTTRYALWAFHRIHFPRLLMVNLPETDIIGHFAHTPAAPMTVLMRHFDAELGQIIDAYRQARILQKTVFVVTADHGMSAVHSRIPFSIFDRAIALAGATKVYLEADTAAAIGIKETGMAFAVARNVALLGHGKIDATYYKWEQHGKWEYLPAFVRAGTPKALRTAYRTLMDTAAADDGPDVIAVYSPHTTTGDRPANGYHWWGGHLGPGWDEQHIPLIIAGAGVRHGQRTSYPARLVDIAPTVAHLLGLPIGRVDGVVLDNALSAGNATLARRQQGAGSTLSPLVRALRARSHE
jgi:hypothetical protein